MVLKIEREKWPSRALIFFGTLRMERFVRVTFNKWKWDWLIIIILFSLLEIIKLKTKRTYDHMNSSSFARFEIYNSIIGMFLILFVATKKKMKKKI